MTKHITAMILLFAMTSSAQAWFDETHLAITKAAGYKKWYNAAAADVARLKIGKIEGYNHYHNSPKGMPITPELVFRQTEYYDTHDPDGHLYGAILSSFRGYLDAASRGRYAENHLAFMFHYIGDLSMPLHHLMFTAYNQKVHLSNDGIIENEVLANIDKIRIYAIVIASEADLAREVARIATLSKELGHLLETEDRLMTREEAYRQISHSASLVKSVLAYAASR